QARPLRLTRPAYRSHVTFLILPALDVWHGRLAVATAEGPSPVDAFGGDPVEAARAAVAAGARALHLVDLDLAYGGVLGLDVAAIRAVAPAAALQVSGGIGGAGTGRSYLDARADRPTYAAGGIRSLEDLRALRDVGGAGAVVGTAALEGRFDLARAFAWAEA